MRAKQQREEQEEDSEGESSSQEQEEEGEPCSMEEDEPEQSSQADSEQEEEDDAEALPRGGKRSRTAAAGTSSRTAAAMDVALEDEEAKRQANIEALVSGKGLQVRRAPLTRYLSLQQSDLVLKRAFVSPMPGAPPVSEELRRRLAARRKFVPWGSSTPWAPPTQLMKPASPPPVLASDPAPPAPPPAPAPAAEELPEGIEPLVLWVPPGATAAADAAPQALAAEPGAVVVDNMLVRWLRPHQREGVAFMFDCVAGLRHEGGRGCILADDMGLGKTLQALTLLWTMTTCGHELLGGRPMARRSLIVCPTSLVGNWASEAKKWLHGRLAVLALCEASRDDVVVAISQFLHPSNPYKVLIVSYETFRVHAESFRNPGSCDLLICDEAHRLKNDATLTNRALGSLPCDRRVLLSGTPMQNHLDEFYAMVDFTNPGVLGTPGEFRRKFEHPILAGREPGASAEVAAAGEARSAELSGIVNAFILRRTNTLLSAHLPPKVVMVVCCRLTQLQSAIYKHFLESKAARKILGGKASSSNAVLPAISNLKKLCNHPKLIYDAVHSKDKADKLSTKGGGAASKKSAVAGFEGVAHLFPPCLFDDGRPGRGAMAVGWEDTSGKFGVAARMLAVLWHETDDKIVLVSNYTQTLDLFGQLCRERNYPVLRLDGSTSVSKREKLVQAFNDKSQRNFVFLLSSKAGGCGLNLVGANRLLLFDCDWNPAVDKQAAARVWRDGQKRRVFVYRFVATGTIEEKVFQRQISKEGLQALVSAKSAGGGGGGGAKNLMSAEELRELFTYHEHSLSHTHDVLCREQGSEAQDEAEEEEQRREEGEGEGEGEEQQAGAPGEREAAGRPSVFKEQQGSPSTEEELAAWGHHSDPATVPDAVLQRSAGQDVSFVFSCQVAGRPVDETVFRPREAPLEHARGMGGRRVAGSKRPTPGGAPQAHAAATAHTAPQLGSRPAPSTAAQATSAAAAGAHQPAAACTQARHLPSQRPPLLPVSNIASGTLRGAAAGGVQQHTAAAAAAAAHRQGVVPATGTLQGAAAPVAGKGASERSAGGGKAGRGGERAGATGGAAKAGAQGPPARAATQRQVVVLDDSDEEMGADSEETHEEEEVHVDDGGEDSEATE